MNRSLGRSVLAIVAGFLFIGVCATGADLALKAGLPESFGPGGRVDSVPLLLFMQGYVALFAITGCWLAAHLAPNHPMRHALILGALGFVFNIVGISQMWDTAPAWFHVMSLALVMPYAWFGGWLHTSRRNRDELGRSTGSRAAAQG